MMKVPMVILVAIAATIAALLPAGHAATPDACFPKPTKPWCDTSKVCEYGQL